MNRQLKRVSIVVLLMFVALFCSTSILQVVETDSLSQDPRNTRAQLDRASVQRGAILVAGKPIAQSQPVDAAYRFQRVYTDGPLYSAITGFFPVQGAATGLESALNKELSGTTNEQFFDRLNSIITGKQPQGDSVELTIDPVAQKAAYEALGDQRGAVVLLQPKTGRILAMVSKPAFDPNDLAGHDSSKVDDTYQKLLKAPGDPLINKALNSLNPPGSTFKLVVTSAALESGRFTKDSTFDNAASLTLPQSDTTIYNAPSGTCGPGAKVTIETAQVRSCNIPFAELGMELGSDPIKKQAEAYGFNHRFSVPMPVTPSSYPGYSADAYIAMSAFGQKDDRATPLQMAMVSAAIANGGEVMEPSIVETVRSRDFTKVHSFSPTEYGRAISADTAKTITELMVEGVDHGAASNARIEGTDVAGKTGTAQNGGDAPYTLWFTGFAPADDPDYAIAVVVENGGGLGQSGYGNTVAAPIARKVLEAVLRQ